MDFVYVPHPRYGLRVVRHLANAYRKEYLHGVQDTHVQQTSERLHPEFPGMPPRFAHTAVKIIYSTATVYTDTPHFPDHLLIDGDDVKQFPKDGGLNYDYDYGADAAHDDGGSEHGAQASNHGDDPADVYDNAGNPVHPMDNARNPANNAQAAGQATAIDETDHEGPHAAGRAAIPSSIVHQPSPPRTPINENHMRPFVLTPPTPTENSITESEHAYERLMVDGNDALQQELEEEAERAAVAAELVDTPRTVWKRSLNNLRDCNARFNKLIDGLDASPRSGAGSSSNDKGPNNGTKYALHPGFLPGGGLENEPLLNRPAPAFVFSGTLEPQPYPMAPINGDNAFARATLAAGSSRENGVLVRDGPVLVNGALSTSDDGSSSGPDPASSSEDDGASQLKFSLPPRRHKRTADEDSQSLDRHKKRPDTRALSARSLERGRDLKIKPIGGSGTSRAHRRA